MTTHRQIITGSLSIALALSLFTPSLAIDASAYYDSSIPVISLATESQNQERTITEQEFYDMVLERFGEEWPHTTNTSSALTRNTLLHIMSLLVYDWRITITDSKPLLDAGVYGVNHNRVVVYRELGLSTLSFFDDPYVFTLDTSNGLTSYEASLKKPVTYSQAVEVLDEMSEFYTNYLAQVPRISYPVFSDVSDNHWAKEAISELTLNQAMDGVGNGQFAPDREVTYAEWIKMIVTTFYSHKMVSGDGSSWYSDYIATADSLKLLDKFTYLRTTGEVIEDGNIVMCRRATGNGPTNYDSSNPQINITRYDVAELAFRVIADKSVVKYQESMVLWGKDFLSLGWGAFDLSNYNSSVIADWDSIPEEHREAVARCYWAGILTGTDDGAFHGEDTLTRAQAAQVLYKLICACDGNLIHPAWQLGSRGCAYKEVCENGVDAREFVAHTPIKYFNSLEYQFGGRYLSELGEGMFVLDRLGLTGPGLDIAVFGYSTVTYTLTALDEDVYIRPVEGEVATPAVLAGETRTFTENDLDTSKGWTIYTGNKCIISNIVFR